MTSLRVAVISTPRCGNTWVRSVLGDILKLEQFAVHSYTELESIPERAIVQLHWYREPGFQRFLRDYGFKTLVLARHPLDVLLSILNFIRHEPSTARWLEGNAEIPSTLAGQPPTSREFLQYATSWGAENVLGISYTAGPLSTYGAVNSIAMTEVGTRHVGFDCFVFPVAWVSQFVPTQACVGAG